MTGYTPPVPRRAILAFALAAAVLAWPLGSVASTAGIPSGRHVADQNEGTLTLRVRTRLGPWKKSLYLRLNKNRLSAFSVCGIRNWDGTEKFDCETASARLPERSSLRLEQSPVAKALKRPDSPGWGMLGLTSSTRVGAVVSNVVTGNRYGTYRYRVTMRNPSGQVLATSNLVSVTWHK